jgi:hypothetical protein
MEEQITSVYNIKEHFPRERPKHRKQLTVQEMCQNPSEQALSLPLSLQLPVAVFLLVSLHHHLFLKIYPQMIP